MFEIKNLENKIFSSADCEDFSSEQDPADHQLLIKQLITTLYELSIRDTNQNFTRRIQESQILNLIHDVVKYNTSEKSHLVEKFLPQCKYFQINISFRLLIGWLDL